MPQAAGGSSAVDASVATGGTKDAILRRGAACGGQPLLIALATVNGGACEDGREAAFLSEARAWTGGGQSHASMALAERDQILLACL